jgi:putative MATE family efflux protein
VLASTCGSILALTFLKRSILKDCFGKLFPIEPAQIRRIVNIGLPSGLQRMVWAISVFVLIFLFRLCEHPTAAVASWTIGMRVEGVVFMPLLALSMAVSSIVGQNLGAKQIDRAVKAGWHVTNIGVALMLIMGSLLFLLADPLARQMSQDPYTIMYVTEYLKINACSEPFLALGMVLAGALQGAGDTKTPMWIGIATHWIFRMPIALFLVLGLHMGPRGAWLAMATSIVGMGLLTVWRYQSKGWLNTKI